MATPSRGVSVVTSFDLNDVPADLTREPPISEDELWANLEYFLRRVLPVAERANVKLSMHPADPPISPIRGVGRIMRSIDNFRRLVDLVPSPMNTITLCQGNFTLMTDDLPTAIRKFGKKISFIHFRDVRGVASKFEESWHDAGKTDMLACMRAYRAIGFDGALRPDHVPTVEGDSNQHAGYSAYGRQPAARACLMSLAADFTGHEVFYIAAPDTTNDVPSLELAERYYPGVPIRGDLGANKSFFDSSKAGRLLGWRHDLPEESRRA